MRQLAFVKYLLLVLISSCTTSDNKVIQSEEFSLIKKIDILLKDSKDKTFNDSIHFDRVIKAHKIAKEISNDSLIAKSLLQFVKISYPLKAKDSFLLYYPKALTFSKNNNDTLTRAQTHNYTAYFYQKNNNIDSAYYHYYQGSKYFKLLNDNYQVGKMLLNMAIIQKNKRDYKGSEEVTKQSLEYLLKTGSNKYIASAYNNLGIINDELKKISVSIKYHQKALAIRKTLKKEPILVVESINNIATAYKDNGDYKKAFNYFDSIKPYKKILESYPKTKARVIDNLAHTRLLNGTTQNVFENMKKALGIRKEENHLTGVMVSYLHLSEYFRYINDEKSSFEYAKKAKKLSNTNKNYRDVLKALRLLSTSKMKRNNENFINEYYRISDSLEKERNLVSDYFARIRFETDEKEKENKQSKLKINNQEDEIKNKNLMIFLLASIAILILSILFIINKTLKYRKELYKEFNHRTRNNLVEIQRGVLKVKNNSNISINELEGITESQLLLYSILEQNNHPTHIYIDDYLTKLVQSLMLINKSYNVIFKFEMKSFKVTSKKASIVGLIINEFLTNAFKHGFSKGIENCIEILISELNREIHLIINTSGKEWNPKFPKGNGDGLKLIQSLSKKILAKIRINYKSGITSLNLIFLK